MNIRVSNGMEVLWFPNPLEVGHMGLWEGNKCAIKSCGRRISGSYRAVRDEQVGHIRLWEGVQVSHIGP